MAPRPFTVAIRHGKRRGRGSYKVIIVADCYRPRSAVRRRFRFSGGYLAINMFVLVDEHGSSGRWGSQAWRCLSAIIAIAWSRPIAERQRHECRTAPTARIFTFGFAIAMAGCSTALGGRFTFTSRVRANGRRATGRLIRFELRLAMGCVALPSSISQRPSGAVVGFGGQVAGTAGFVAHASLRRPCRPCRRNI